MTIIEDNQALPVNLEPLIGLFEEIGLSGCEVLRHDEPVSLDLETEAHCSGYPLNWPQSPDYRGQGQQALVMGDYEEIIETVYQGVNTDSGIYLSHTVIRGGEAILVFQVNGPLAKMGPNSQVVSVSPLENPTRQAQLLVVRPGVNPQRVLEWLIGINNAIDPN